MAIIKSVDFFVNLASSVIGANISITVTTVVVNISETNAEKWNPTARPTTQ
jgi:hypothetical protein